MKSVSKLFKGKGSKRPRRDPGDASSHSNSQSTGEDMEEEVGMQFPDDEFPVQPTGDTYGIHFIYHRSVKTFQLIRSRVFKNTCFYQKDDMKGIWVHEGVNTLFKNIGWEGFLTWDEVGYRRPTIEFLSSCAFMNGVLRFRVYNQNYSITAARFNELSGAPTENTYPNPGSFGHDSEFNDIWKSWTGLDNYNSRHSKSSDIIHPVIRVVARHLTRSFFCREESGSINKTELSIIHFMITCRGPAHSASSSHPQQMPGFGEFMFHKLCEPVAGENTPSHSAGLVTKIMKYCGVVIPADEPKLTSARYFGKAGLVKGSVLKENPRSKGITWLLGKAKTPYLEVNRKNANVLKLKTPTSETDWLLTFVLGQAARREEVQTEDDEEAGPSDPVPRTGPSNPPFEPARHSEASYFTGLQNSYKRLHADYEGLSGQYSSLHGDYTALHGSYSTMSTDLASLRGDYTALHGSYSSMRSDINEERTENTLFRSEVRTFMADYRERQEQSNSLNDMVHSLFRWHIDEHPSNRPQPPPDRQ